MREERNIFNLERDAIGKHNGEVGQKVDKEMAENILEFIQGLELSDEAFAAVSKFTKTPDSIYLEKIEVDDKFYEIPELNGL